MFGSKGQGRVEEVPLARRRVGKEGKGISMGDRGD